MLRILAIGDVVGKPGRIMLKERLNTFIADRGVDFCIANGENAAGGSGLTPALNKKEIIRAFNGKGTILRPANYQDGTPGSGFAVVNTDKGVDVAVILLLGRVFMDPIDCPFSAVDRTLARIAGRAKVIIVDMHAEATSEKKAMGYYLDSRVSAVLGTHTHVQTSDECILSGGTAYITDLGMTGPTYSILGRRVDRVLKRFTTGMPASFDVAKGPSQLNGVMVDIDTDTGLALKIDRFVLD